jgi:hypothetical protein
LAATKPEYGPACAECAIVNGYKFITAEKCTRIVLALHITVYQVNIFAVVKMEAVIVPVYPVINSNAINMYLLATKYTEAMVCAGSTKNVKHA